MSKPLTIGSLKRNTREKNRQANKESQDTPINSDINAYDEQSESGPSSKVYAIQKGVVCGIQPMQHKTLLDSALEQGCHLEHKCKKGTCGKCAVRVLKGQSVLTEPNDQEREKIGSELENGYRLACQTLLSN